MTKICRYKLTPLKPPLLYSKTGVYRGIHYFSYFYSKYRLLYSLEPSRRVSTIYVLSRNMKKYQSSLSDKFQFFWDKISIHLNRRVFIMVQLNLIATEKSKIFTCNRFLVCNSEVLHSFFVSVYISNQVNRLKSLTCAEKSSRMTDKRYCSVYTKISLNLDR